MGRQRPNAQLVRTECSACTRGAHHSSAVVAIADTGGDEARVEGDVVVDLTELDDDPRDGDRGVRIDGALVRGETAAPDPEMLRSLLRGLQEMDVDAPVQRHEHVMT